MRATSCHDPNESLTRFLNRYCGLTAPPGYAVMLCGPWGSGKTWFIEKYQEALKAQGKRVLYVSLFGVSKVSDITDQFFAQIHPNLSDPRVQKAWGILKSFIKGSVKLDLYGDKQADASLQIAIPEIEKWASTEGAILVFDDLERCNMALDDLLGFINQFVEHDGYRVIVLANEGADSLNQESGFPKIKEKVIGRTFLVQPNAEAALEHFLHEINAPLVNELLMPRKNLILQVFWRAQYKNLRQLRQAIFDFSDLVAYLQLAKEPQNKQFVDRLLEDVLTLSIEHRAGILTTADIRSLGEVNWASYMNLQDNGEEGNVESTRDRALKRHGFDSMQSFALPTSAYADFYENGSLSESAATNALANSKYLATQETPSWRRLWYLFDLNNSELEPLFRDVYKKFVSLEYIDEGELLHVVSMMFNLSSIGLIEKTTTQMGSTARRVSLQLVKKDRIDLGTTRDRHESPMRHMSAYGLGFTDPNSTAFRNFCAFYLQQKDIARTKRVRRQVKEWMDMLTREPEAWAMHLSRDAGKESWFSDVPVFPYISAKAFSRFLFTSQTPTIELIQQTLEERFSHSYEHCQWKAQELPFLKGLAQFISIGLNKIGRRRLPLSHYFIEKRFMPVLKKSITSLEHFQEQKSESASA